MFNQTTLVGYLGKDAEIRYTPGGTACANFSVATTEKWKDKDGNKQERTEWTRCVLWGKVAEAVGSFLTKGKLVLVQGRMETRKWEDKDGNDRYTTELKVQDIKLLPSGGKRAEHDESGSQEREERQPAPAAAGATEDDIPF